MQTHDENAKAMENFMEILKNEPWNACDYIEGHYQDISQENFALITKELILFAECICKENFESAMCDVAIAIRESLDEQEYEKMMHEESLKLAKRIEAECIKRMEEKYGADWMNQDSSVKSEVLCNVLSEIDVYSEE